jgi:hypothetical protein
MSRKRLLWAFTALLVVVGALSLVSILRAEQAGQYFNVTPFQCRVTAATVATECQAAPAAGLRNYVTDVVVSNNVGTAQTLKLVTGTGTNCGTGTADLTHAVQFGAAVGNWDHTYSTPLKPPTASAVCVTPSAATSYSATIVGFVGQVQ